MPEPAAPLTGINWPDGRLPNAAFFMGDSEFPGDSSWGDDTSQVVEFITITGGEQFWDNVRTAIKTIMGTNAVGNGAKLNRVPPMRHPVFTWMTAARINSIKGVGRIGQDKNSGLGVYYRAVLAVTFVAQRYRVATNQTTTAEDNRWVIKESQSSTFFVSLQGVVYTFPVVVPAPTGEIFNGVMGKRISENLYTWTWVSVPINGVMDSSGRPTNIAAVAGRVNSATWNGFAAQTLLMDSPRIRFKVAPVSPTDMGLAGSDPPILCDVTYCFREALPPRTTQNDFPKRNGSYAVPTDGQGNRVYEAVAFASYVFVPLNP
jgi:hypothetical protein